MALPRIQSLWVRKLSGDNFVNIEREGGLNGGGGAKYIEAPTSILPALLEMLELSISDFQGNGFPIETRVIGAPAVSAPILWGRKVDENTLEGQRLRLFQNRHSNPNPRHPAWHPRRGFPVAPPGSVRAGDVHAITDQGLRVYVVKDEHGEFYAGFLYGGIPDDWPEHPALRAVFVATDFAGDLEGDPLFLDAASKTSPFRLADGDASTSGAEPEEVVEDDAPETEGDGDWLPEPVVGKRGGYASPETARKVDDVAMELALAWAHSTFSGLSIRRMPHNNPGYDILVHGKGPERFIEVKGTLRPEPRFFMSENERRYSVEHSEIYTLVVFHSIDLEARTGTMVRRDGAIEPTDGILEPSQWRGLLS